MRWYKRCDICNPENKINCSINCLRTILILILFHWNFIIPRPFSSPDINICFIDVYIWLIQHKLIDGILIIGYAIMCTLDNYKQDPFCSSFDSSKIERKQSGILGILMYVNANNTFNIRIKVWYHKGCWRRIYFWYFWNILLIMC